jgi:hypothetical protein
MKCIPHLNTLWNKPSSSFTWWWPKSPQNPLCTFHCHFFLNKYSLISVCQSCNHRSKFSVLSSHTQTVLQNSLCPLNGVTKIHLQKPTATVKKPFIASPLNATSDGKLLDQEACSSQKTWEFKGLWMRGTLKHNFVIDVMNMALKIKSSVLFSFLKTILLNGPYPCQS